MVNKGIVCGSLVFILVLSFVSAGLFSDLYSGLTGHVISISPASSVTAGSTTLKSNTSASSTTSTYYPTSTTTTVTVKPTVSTTTKPNTTIVRPSTNSTSITPGVFSCTDSDGGDKPFTFGTVVYGGKSYSDMCGVALNVLTENFCNGSRPATRQYTCQHTCRSGACVEQPPNQTITCYDDAGCPPQTLIFCQNGSACGNTTNYRCENPGTPSSRCAAFSGGGYCHSCSSGCQNGFCIGSNCTDSDGGDKPYIKGRVLDSARNDYTDFCYDDSGLVVPEGDHLREFVCQGEYYGYIEYNASCIDGALVQSNNQCDDSFKFESPDKKLNLRENLRSVWLKPINDSSMPRILASQNYVDSDSQSFFYLQSIQQGTAPFSHFRDPDFNNNVPVLGFKISANQNILNYTLSFTDYPSLAKMPGTDIEILGKKYLVTSAATDKLVLSDVLTGDVFELYPYAGNVKFNDQIISDLSSSFLVATGNLRWITLEWKSSDKLFLAPASELIMPGFGSIKLSMADVTIPDREMTKIESTGDYASINTILKDDNEYLIPFLYIDPSSGSILGSGKSSTERLATSDTQTLTYYGLKFGDNYDRGFVASWNNGRDAESYYLRFVGITANIDAGRNEASLVTVPPIGGESVTLCEGLYAGQTCNVGSITLTVVYIGYNSTDRWVTAIINSGGSFNTFYTKDGLKLSLPPYPSTGGALLKFGEADKYGSLDREIFNMTIDGTGGINGAHEVTVSSVNTASTFQETSSGSKVWETYMKTPLATKVIWDKTNSNTYSANVEYHGGEVYANVYLLDAACVNPLGGGGGGSPAPQQQERQGTGREGPESQQGEGAASSGGRSSSGSEGINSQASPQTSSVQKRSLVQSISTWFSNLFRRK
ncbi:Uncharacterised protein [uncultured archaeon]|nr:Uncharacterised protein [uncultured archaeon]